MARNGISLDGIDALLADLRQRGGQAAARVERVALKTAGELMADDMRKRAPRSAINHEHLADNIVVSGIRRKDGVKYVLVGPNKKLKWRAHFPEFGTTNMPARPYIEPAFHAKKREALQIIADELRKGLL